MTISITLEWVVFIVWIVYDWAYRSTTVVVSFCSLCSPYFFHGGDGDDDGEGGCVCLFFFFNVRMIMIIDDDH